MRGTLALAADQAAKAAFFNNTPDVVVFANGTLTVDAEEIKLHSHSPDFRARFAFGFPFAPHAQPALWLQFLAEAFRDDADREQKLALVQEYLGLSLLGLATKFQRVLVLVGEGANGKGVLSSVIERCMPPGSVCAIPPQQLGQEYRRAMIAGKLLNIVSELPEADILDSESWKAIVAGDTTSGREIREAVFTFKPIAGHIYSANRLPGTSDQTHGFWRRIIVVQFNRVFEEHEQDPHLADRIARTEVPAIVSWALEGAQRVLRQGHYTTPSSAAAALDDWRRDADQVRGFVEERTSPLAADAKKSMGTAANIVYDAYKAWALANGHKPLSSTTFGRRMGLLKLKAESDGSVRRHPLMLRH